MSGRQGIAELKTLAATKEADSVSECQGAGSGVHCPLLENACLTVGGGAQRLVRLGGFGAGLTVTHLWL